MPLQQDLLLELLLVDDKQHMLQDHSQHSSPHSLVGSLHTLFERKARSQCSKTVTLPLRDRLPLPGYFPGSYF
jgi:hypothetical protein